MKPRIISPSRLSFSLAAALAALFAVSTAQAVTLYWDGTTSTANADGGNGNWNDNSTTNWDTLAFGGADSVWLNSNPDIAVFGGAAGTVSLTSAITAGGITFNTTGYTLAGDGAQTLSFATGDNVILFNNIAAASTSSGASAGLKLGGAGNVILSASTPATAGALTLQYNVAGDHSIGWSGSTTINAGMTLALNGRDLSLSSTSGITLNGGGITLTNTNSTQGAFDRVSSNAITANGGTVTYTNTSGSGLIYGETIGAVDLNRGQTNFALTTNMAGGGGNVQTLTLGVSGSGLTRTGATNTSAVSFGSASGLNITTNIIQVFGASGTGTGSGQIVGPWASYGTTPSAPTDYAVYDASGRVLNASIGATAQDSVSWTAGGNNVTLNAPTTLTGTRTLNSLRYSGAAGSLALGANNLETYGLLIGGAGLTISGTGALTTPTGGGNLYLTPGAAAITVSAPINNNSGAVTLVKSGSNTLTLSNASNNYSGGTVLNAGTLAISANSHLGDVSGGITVNGVATLDMSNNPASYNTARPITVNDGAALTMNGGSGGTSNKQFQGVLSGNGTLTISSNFNANFNNAGNTFTGTIVNQAGTLSFSSLGNSPNPIIVSGGNITWNGGAKTFGPFTLNAAGTFLFSNNGTGALAFPQPLAFSGANGARTLSLGGSNTGANQFAGAITDGPGASVVSLNKQNDGSWALSGTNTYSGATTYSQASNPNPGFLTFQGIQALSPNTSLSQTQTSGNSAIGTFRILDDSASPASRSGVNLNFSNNSDTTTDTRIFMKVFVGNNNVANGGTSASTQTGSTIQLGNMNFTQGAAAHASGAGLAVTGANGYKLQIANVNVNLQAAAALTWNVRLQGDTAPILVGGNVLQAAGATSGNVSLQLDGTNTGNQITGNILNSADGSPRLLSLSKTGAGTWTLGGTNSYTGTTGVSAGMLRFTGNSSGATGNVSVTGGALGGNGGSLGGAVTVSSTGSLDLRDVSVGNLTLSSTLNITGAAGANNLRFDMGNGTGTSDQLIVAGTSSVTTAGSAVIDLNWLGGTSGRTPGTYTLIGGAGALALADFNKFSLGVTAAFGQTYTLVHDLVSDGGTGNLQVTTANATAVTAAAAWAGSTSVNWSASTNWRTAPTGNVAVAGAPDFSTNVTFSTTAPVAANLATILDVDFDINAVNFGNTTAVSIGGTRTLTLEATNAGGNTLGRGITSTQTTVTNTISSKVGLAASQTWSVAGTTAALGGLTVSGAISDFGLGNSLTKDGTGTLTLSGTNTYTGGTIINAGTVAITNHVNLGGAGRNITFGGSATLNGTSASTFGALAVNSGTATFGSATSYAFTSTTGSGNITFNGQNNSGNTLDLGSASGFTGTLRNNIGGTGNVPTKGIHFTSLGETSGSRMQFSGTDGDGQQSERYRLYGDAGPLTMSTRAVEFLNPGGTNAFNRALLQNDNTNAANKWVITPDLINNTNRTHSFELGGTNTGDNEFAGVIINSTNGGHALSLIKQNAGKWILSNTNTYTGGTTLSAGTLNANAANALGTGNVTVNAGTLVVEAANAIADTAALRLPSAAAKNLTMNANDTVGSLFLAGVQQPNGNYSFSTNASAWMNTGSGILTVGSATAQPVYWDLDGATAGAGSAAPSDTWNAGNTFWNNAAGDGTAAVWSAGATAVFSAGTNATGNYTVTVDGTQDIGGLTFEEGNVTLTGGTALRLLSNSLASVATGLTATISTSLTQDAPARTLTKIGLGTLTLANDNSYTGATTLSQGTLQLAHVNAIALSPSMSMATGTTLDLRKDTTGGTFTNTRLNPTGTVTLNADRISAGSGQTLTLGGTVVYVSAANPQINFTGGNTYAAGINAIYVNLAGNGNSLILNPTTANAVIGAISANTGTTNPSGFGAGTSGNINFVLGGNAGTNNTITSITELSGSATELAITKNTAATWTVTGDVDVKRGNNHTVSAGTLNLGGTFKIDNVSRTFTVSATGVLGYNNAGALRFTDGTTKLVMAGGSLDNTGPSPITTSTYNPGMTWSGNWTFIGTNGANSNLNLGTGAVAITGSTRQVSVTNADTTLTVGGIISGVGFGLTKAGAGALKLSGNSSYNGATTVSAGTLSVTGSLGTTAVSVNAGTLSGNGNFGGNVTIASGATHAIAVADAVLNQDTTVITGTLAMADSILNLTAASPPAAGQYVLATATVGITGTPTTINYNGITGVVSVDTVSSPKRLLLTVTADAVPPTLISIADNVSGGPIDINATVTYTVTFDEDMDASTVTAADFNNAGTATVSIGTITETTPGVFTVLVTPSTSGTLRLQIPTTAVLTDVAGNPLDNDPALLDDTTITVRTIYDTWANATYVPPLTMKLAGDDQDGDTFNNLMEFAFGTHPTVSSSGSIVWVDGGAVTTPGQPVAINMANPGVDYRAVFGRRKDYAAAGLTYTVEFSAGLNVWVPSAVTPTVLTGAGGLNASEIEAVSVPYPLLIDVGGNNFKKPTFFRLTISN